MMINLGVGVKKTTDPAQSAVDTQNQKEVETEENGDGDLLDKVERHINSAQGNVETSDKDVQMHIEQEEDNSDITILNTIVEEMYDRFSDADIHEILQICEEVLGGGETRTDEV